jgi:tetratricopeptide (TPR) repeat protein
MTSPAAIANLIATGTSAAGASVLQRRLFRGLAFFALVYAFLAGLHTVSDYDLGWQMATARWVVQHHHIPSVDVLSFTARGQPWTYPIGAGLIFYAAYLVGGFSLISWIGAAACCGTVALLLRRGSAVSGGIAILAVPLIAYRTSPRADMFTVVLFAAFLSLLWENYQTGRARLWLLPLLMVAWVNLHFGFSSGLGLIGAYVLTELLETPFGEARRSAALRRLRSAAGWFVATALVTVINPWGWGIYRALLRQQRANAAQQFWISEWTSMPLHWSSVRSAFFLRETSGALYLMLTIAIVAGLLALLRTQIGAALLLLGSIYPAVHYVRMAAIFSCIVVVVGAPVLSWAIEGVGARMRPARLRLVAATSAVVLLAGLAALRGFDLVTNRYYFGTDEASFGAGLSRSFPARAVEFIRGEKLPGEIFNTYDVGGYLTWALGPERLVYIDGRDTLFGVSRIQRSSMLLLSPSDSSAWEQEVSRYNINTVLLSFGGYYNGPKLQRLKDFCESKQWSPVYLDEGAAVFVRRTPQTEDLVRRFPMDCATAPLPHPPPGANRAEAFSAWKGAAVTLAGLGRSSEALAATDKALAIYSGNPLVRWNRAQVLFAMGRLNESEQDYLATIAMAPSAFAWSSLAQSYLKRGRVAAATDAMRHAAEFSDRPYLTLTDLAYIDLDTGQPHEALEAFDEAVHLAPSGIDVADGGYFHFRVAQGRSGAWGALGDLNRATSYQEEAVKFLPNAAEAWRRLAQLYQRQKRPEDAKRAEEQAARVGATQSP